MIGRALVTGGAGFIGSALVDRLIDDGTDVLVVDDLSSGRLSNLAMSRRGHQMSFHQIDVLDPALIDAAARYSPEVVFHLAAQVSVARSVDDPVGDATLNVAGTVNTLVAAREAGARMFVNTSSGGAVYGTPDDLPVSEDAPRRPESPYGVSKGIVDGYLRHFEDAYGLDWVSIGPSNVYGPRQDPYGEAGVVAIFVQTLLDGRPPTINGDGTITRDYVYVEDVVDAMVRAGERGGGRFLNVGTGRETTVLEVFELLARITGRTNIKPGFGPPRPGDALRSCLDPSAATHHLGWEPWTSLEDGLARTVEWFRSRRA